MKAKNIFFTSFSFFFCNKGLSRIGLLTQIAFQQKMQKKRKSEFLPSSSRLFPIVLTLFLNNQWICSNTSITNTLTLWNIALLGSNSNVELLKNGCSMLTELQGHKFWGFSQVFRFFISFLNNYGWIFCVFRDNQRFDGDGTNETQRPRTTNHSKNKTLDLSLSLSLCLSCALPR